MEQTQPPLYQVVFTPTLTLNDTERKVLVMLSVGIKTEEISSLLNKSISAVNAIIRSLKIKTESSNLVALGINATRYNLITEEDLRRGQSIKKTLLG